MISTFMTEGVGCIANISPRERQMRLFAGMIMLLIGLALLGALLALGVNHWWRLVLLFPFCGGMLSIFQWRDKT